MKFNKLIPELSVSNFDKSLKFYVDIGFKIEYVREENKFAFLSFQKSQIMIEEINNNWKTGELEYPFGRGINLQIEVKEIKSLVNKFKKIKYSLFREPKENWYRQNNKMLGNREFLVKDPDGYLLRFSENLKSKSI